MSKVDSHLVAYVKNVSSKLTLLIYSGTIQRSEKASSCNDCPGGYYCSSGTADLKECPPRNYCPPRSFAPTKCPNGTYGEDDETGFASPSDCRPCINGSYCKTGSVKSPSNFDNHKT